MYGKRWLGVVAIVCLSLCIGVGIAHYLKYRSAYEKNIEQVIETSQFQLRFTSREFARVRAQMEATIKLSNRNGALSDFISYSQDRDKQMVESIWLGLSDYQSFFKQMRFVDNQGYEKIKVAYSQAKMQAEVRHDYQHLSPSTFLNFASAIPIGSMGDLRVMPGIKTAKSNRRGSYSPELQVVSPFELKGVRKGYIVLTVDIALVKTILDYSPHPDYMPMLLASSGDYIAHPDPGKLFGFFIEKNKVHNINLTHNTLWQEMLLSRSGVHHDKGGVYIYAEIALTENKSIYSLIHFTAEQLKSHVEKEYAEILEGAVLIIFLIIVACVPFAQLLFEFRKKNVDSSLALAALNGMSAVIICDNAFRTLKVNREFEKMTDYTEAQIRHSNIRKIFFRKGESLSLVRVLDAIKKEHFWEGELILRGNQHKEVITITRVQALLDDQGKVVNYIVSIVDISERKELEERLRYLSERDELSQLWNRRKFEQELRNEAMLLERYPENHKSCLALLDIDFFKRINDEQGHDEGDRVIRNVAHHLAEGTRKTDVTARIGGEEFAIIMKHTSLEDAHMVLERLRERIEQDSSHPVTVSIGFTDITSDTSICYKCADIALYESKSLGRNQISLCHSTDDIA